MKKSISLYILLIVMSIFLAIFSIIWGYHFINSESKNDNFALSSSVRPIPSPIPSVTDTASRNLTVIETPIPTPTSAPEATTTTSDANSFNSTHYGLKFNYPSTMGNVTSQYSKKGIMESEVINFSNSLITIQVGWQEVCGIVDEDLTYEKFTTPNSYPIEVIYNQSHTKVIMKGGGEGDSIRFCGYTEPINAEDSFTKELNNIRNILTTIETE